VRRRRGSAQVERWIWTLHRRVEELRATHAQILAIEIHDLTREDALVDGQKLTRRGIAFVVREKYAVPLGFRRIAAGDDVEQDPPAGKAVERRGHARRRRRGNDPRSHCHEEAQPLGHGHHRRRDDPGVLAGSAGGEQHTVETERVGGPRDLAEVREVDGAGPVRGPEVATVAVRGKKP